MIQQTITKAWPKPERQASDRPQWSYAEKWWGQIAIADFKGLRLCVRDCDGDRSWWSVSVNGEEIASGEDAGVEPYHFHKCIEICEGVAIAKAGAGQ